MDIQPRDSKILLDLYRYKNLTKEQIELLHFKSSTANRRLKILRDHRLIGEQKYTASDINTRVFYLKQRGERHVIDYLGYQAPVNHTYKPPSVLFLRHLLKINDFGIQLREDCRQAEIGVKFVPEYFCQLRLRVYGQQQLSHIPDAMFILSRKGRRRLFYLEVDRGTERKTGGRDAEIAKMLRFYQALSRAFAQNRQNTFKAFWLLIVVPDDRRIRKMQEIAVGNSLCDRFKKFVRLTSFSEMSIFKEWYFLDDSPKTELVR